MTFPVFHTTLEGRHMWGVHFIWKEESRVRVSFEEAASVESKKEIKEGTNRELSFLLPSLAQRVYVRPWSWTCYCTFTRLAIVVCRSNATASTTTTALQSLSTYFPVMFCVVELQERKKEREREQSRSSIKFSTQLLFLYGVFLGLVLFLACWITQNLDRI